MPLARPDEVFGADISLVHQVLGRGQPLGGQGVVDGPCTHRFVHVGGCGVGVHHRRGAPASQVSVR